MDLGRDSGFLLFLVRRRVGGREVEEDLSLCNVFLFVFTASFTVIWQQRHYLMIAMDMGYIRIIF